MELMYNPLAQDALTPRGMMKLSLAMMQVTAEAFKLVLPGKDYYAVWQEFQNKLQAFDLFENVDAALQLPSGTGLPLATLLDRCSALGPYSAVWATEGVGHYYTEKCWRERGIVRGLLRSNGAAVLPTESLIALHAGMGLSFATHLLEARPSSHKLRSALEKFIVLCRDNSRQEYSGASFEALGLAARNLHPHLVLAIDRELASMTEELAGYFWHGVGRALYFSPTNFLPGGSAPWRAVEAAKREAPHEVGQRNALAGVVWALVLVNIRHPQVLELFLQHHGRELERNDAFASGLTSALVVWRDSAPTDVSIEKLYSHSPADQNLIGLWNTQVRQPCVHGLQRYCWGVREGDCLGRLFRYQPLRELSAELESRRCA